MFIKDLVTCWYKRIEATKKVSKMNISPEELAYIFNIVYGINALEPEDVAYQTVNCDDINLPLFASSEVVPAKVALSTERFFPDLVDRDLFKFDVDGKPIERLPINLSDIRNIGDKISGMYKTDPKFFNVKDMRKCVSIFDVNVAIPINGVYRTRLDSQNYFTAVPLKKEVSAIYGQHSLNEDAEWVEQRYIMNWSM